MEIGDKFIVDYQLEFVYEKQDKGHYRRAVKERLEQPREVYLIGLRYKQEGWYNESSVEYSSGFEPDWGPPYLAIDNVVKCALVTPNLRRKGFFVLWEDLES